MAHVSIPYDTPLRVYVAAAGQVAFPVAFPFFSSADVVVVVNGQEVTPGYSVTGTAVDGGFQSGTVTLAAPPGGGARVVVYRRSIISRTTDFPYPTQVLDIQALNTELDRIFAVALDLYATGARSLRFPLGDPAIGEIPSAALRAGRILGFDENGYPVVTSASAYFNLPDLEEAADEFNAAVATILAAEIRAQASALSAQGAAAQALDGAAYITANIARGEVAADQAAMGAAVAVPASNAALALASLYGDAIVSPPTTTPEALVGTGADLGGLAGGTAPFAIERLPPVRADLSRGAGFILNLGSVA